MARAAGLRAGLATALLAQRGRLILWVPICLGLGIGGWFALRVEPGQAAYLACGLGALALLALGRLAGEAAAPLLWGLALVLCGALLAGARAHSVTAPVLGFRYYGPVEGRIIDIDRSVSDKPRLTLDRVVLSDVRPGRTPERVRVSLHGDQGFIEPEPGLTVILTGHLSPPSGPVEPGGFDFRRMAWFERLGAVGYTRTPLLAIAPAEEGRAGLAIFRWRMALSQGVQARVSGSEGAFIAAILTGDRSGLPQEELDALRGSNLAHLLAISGLHMGLLTAVVFGIVRLCLAAIPWVALRWPLKKIAAVVALAAGAAYLALSGGNVATVRAYIMASVVLVAVLLERRAISLRTVAIAATLVLAITPEALAGAGFQMSFAATTALVAAFAAWRDSQLGPRLPRWTAPVVGLVLSSGVAGAATAPFGAAHFNTISDYGLLANLLSVPLMGSVVMPAAVAAAVLWPLGLEGLALEAMRLGTAWILTVARWVAGLEGAVSRVPAPGPEVLPLLCFGALFWLLWQGRWRHLGVVPILAACFCWVTVERPAVLVSESGTLVGVMTSEGRALSRPRGDGFAARVWLENDGDPADQGQAAARVAPWSEGRLSLGEATLVHATGRAVDALPDVCRPDEIWVLGRARAASPTGGCAVFDPEALRAVGALAIHLDGERAVIVTATDRSGRRLWNTPPAARQ